ncbi:tRNA-specific adenosine deaminase [Parapedobacter pyrenivorans]|uniref:tRNA-specific adenosine deaminase n=1 Tax=Parapedobacter pyrenivorans TaxID=1305674 RepID=A0A917HH30_9SPHI|nr:nucleoside deaminase [Parapedobacter pyrenivorans]GGG79295.1 tRNA-specific adenosine deaminase [Parapedobacter pyrenivorans]
MTTLSENHRIHLQRCVALAKQALAEGNDPFGSLLLAANGELLFEDYNRTVNGNQMLHPELALAQWAVANMTLEERATATVYTSGEHCAMCSAAHAWVGLGRIIYASSSEQLQEWMVEFDAKPSPINPLGIKDVAPAIETEGPYPEFAEAIRELHRKRIRPA